MPLQGPSLGRIKPFEPRSFKRKTSTPATPTAPWLPLTPSGPVPVTPTTPTSPATPTGGSLCRHRPHHGKRRPWARSHLDAWLEKTFSPNHHAQEDDDRRSHRRSRSQQRQSRPSLLHRTLTGLSFSRAAARRRRRQDHKSDKSSEDDVWNDYASELEQYFAEAADNLCDDQQDDDVELDDSDWATPRKAEIIDSDDDEIEEPQHFGAEPVEHVVPPVDVPFRYRAQDRQGGVLVAGDRVLFTNRAFKRQLRRLGDLGPIPERSSSEAPVKPVPYELELPSERFSGQMVEL